MNERTTIERLILDVIRTRKLNGMKLPLAGPGKITADFACLFFLKDWQAARNATMPIRKKQTSKKTEQPTRKF
ncbi:MAG: hypothetical protein OXF09_06940 [Hyphomicrobiales bacterium]|nr:hypothetical protein [Hyphomicrobiales bacterium]